MSANEIIEIFLQCVRSCCHAATHKKDAPCSSGGIYACNGRESIAVNQINAICFVTCLLWQRIWPQIFTLQLFKSTYQHWVSFWPWDRSLVFIVATCPLISDSFFLCNLFFFLWSPGICCFRNALLAALPVINNAIFLCRMQRGAVFLDTVLNLKILDLSACLSWALPSLLSKYAQLILTVNRNSETVHEQSNESKISLQIYMQCVTWVLAMIWCCLSVARCRWERTTIGQQIVVFLQTALLATDH